MPTYQYACTACDHRFEAVQKFTDDSLTVCPECAGALRKVYGSIGVVFKGSGFYRTDARDGGKSGGTDKAPATADKSDSGKSESSSSDSKPAAAKTDTGSGSSKSDSSASSKSDSSASSSSSASKPAAKAAAS